MSLSLSVSLAGDITQKGYEKKRSKLIGSFFPQAPGKTDFPFPFLFLPPFSVHKTLCCHVLYYRNIKKSIPKKKSEKEITFL